MAWRRLGAVAVAALLVLPLVACGGDPGDGAGGPGTSPSAATTEPERETWDLVVLADSSGWGVAEAWAERIRADLGVEVEVTDLAVGMYSGVRLLEDLRTDGSAQHEAVQDAEVIAVWASPVSLEWSADVDQCVFDPTSKDAPTRFSEQDYAPYAQLWRDVLAEINALRAGQPTAVRTRDIYNAAISDHVAAGTAEECNEGLAMTTRTVKDATRLAGATFIPVHAVFNGPDGLRDPRARHLLRDPEHLNARGIRLMVGALHAAGYPELGR